MLTRNAHGITDEFYDRLRAHYDEGSVVEIAAVAGLFNYFNKFNNALRVPPTR
jgi:alkylhydroperoxidase family enzyme